MAEILEDENWKTFIKKIKKGMCPSCEKKCRCKDKNCNCEHGACEKCECNSA